LRQSGTGEIGPVGRDDVTAGAVWSSDAISISFQTDA
jgi:hypothetical protein